MNFTLTRARPHLISFFIRVFNLEMCNFFDGQGRTKVFGRGVLPVRRGLKPAENAAHREKGHLGFETLADGDLQQILPGADILNRNLDQIFRFQCEPAGYGQVTFRHVGR